MGLLRRSGSGVLSLIDRGLLAAEMVTTRVASWGDAPAALAERYWAKLVIERKPLSGSKAG